MYSYDFVHVLLAAIAHAGSVEPDKITAALNQVSTRARTATSAASTSAATRAWSTTTSTSPASTT